MRKLNPQGGVKRHVRCYIARKYQGLDSNPDPHEQTQCEISPLFVNVSYQEDTYQEIRDTYVSYTCHVSLLSFPHFWYLALSWE